MSTMKDSLVVFLEGARVNFRIYGYLLPVFAAVIDGEPQIMGVKWDDNAGKEEFANRISKWISENRLTEFILVAEAWVASNIAEAKKHLAEHGSLENFPGRKELVTVSYCSAREEIECTADIIRGIVGEPTLGEWRREERQVRFNSEDLSTRFQGLFLKGKASQN